ncbi:hypothetical protein TcasGA2_TC002747 [Tribolium castaneum]|uniref:RPGRIP1 C-terminal domain-containing protein n=1 Tax=Tribolium castaneum TaxID=7070 RepID=D6WDM2_TRICA|nr:hypothetical protein TcasGA2_TC002747 [Tribolium castaneum]
MVSVFLEPEIFKVTPLASKRLKCGGDADCTNLNQSVPQIQLILQIKHVKLSNECLQYTDRYLEGKKHIKLVWNFNKLQEEIVSSEVIEHLKVKLGCRAQYGFDVNEDSLEIIRENPVIFELYATNGAKSVLLSEANLYLGDILDLINRKETTRVLFYNGVIDSVNSFAYLSLQYKFTCHKKDVKNFKLTVSNIQRSQGDTQSKTFRQIKGASLKKVESDDSLFRDLDNVLKTTSSDACRSLEKEINCVDYEPNSLWLNACALRNSTEEYKPEFFVTISSLHFLEGSLPMIDTEVEQIYVEYSFLGLEGPEFETPFSVPKGKPNEDLLFNFTKKFDIDVNANYCNCKKMIDLIVNKGVVTFVVVSEQVERLDKPIQTCFELGYSEVSLDEIANLEQNEDTYQYEILDYANSLDVIGYMSIKFEGILAMKQMILTMMANKGYTYDSENMW